MRRLFSAPAPVLFAALALLGGCAAPPPPLLDISGYACTPTPDLVSAMPLPLGDPRDPKVVVLKIDEHARCLEAGDGRSLYGAFQLPDSPQPYMVSVRSVPIGDGIFVPRLLLLDGLGALKREVPRDAFVFRADTLTALIRNHPDERYLVVASVPRAVGETTSRITERTRTSTACSSGGCFIIATGGDTARTMVYAHGGTIGVYAAVIPTGDQQR
jgi:hypothetical protein